MILDRLETRKPTSARAPMIAYILPAALLVPLFGLWLISTPPHAGQRLAELEAKSDRIGKAASGVGDLKTYPAGSVCSGEVSEAMRTRINIMLANTGMQITAFDIGEAGQTERGLTPYHLTFKGSGSYEDALAALDVLNRNRPKLFVDSTSLRNRVSDVDLEIEGRVYCRS